MKELLGLIWVLTSWRLHNELVEGHALATSLGDSGSSGLSESESSNGELGNLEHSLIIGNGGNDDDSSVLVLSKVLHKLGEGERWSVNSGGNKSSEDGLAELGVSSSGEELVELHEEVMVEVLAFGVLLVLVHNSSSLYQINAL